VSSKKLDHWVVYGLFDPRDGQVRYVGVTSYALHHRLSRHLHEVRVRKVCARKADWIGGLVAAGLRPEIAALEVVDSAEGAHECEQFFVCYLRAIGAALLNDGDGGIGSTGRRLSRSARVAIGLKAAARQAGRKRAPLTEEHRQKLRDAWARRRARATEVA
jgi:hypothetical protein